MNTGSSSAGYMAQLDGLRAIAVTAVVLFHWMPEVKQTGLGGLGVQLFFVLSGYLISGILVDARNKADRIGAGKGQIIKSFYARRFLRIFPLYYLVVVAAYFLGSTQIQDNFAWHLGYLTNILIFIKGQWIGEASHLWSLAVEEQFYIFWPFVMLFTPRRYLSATVIGFILLAPAFKLTYFFSGIEESRLGVLPISSFHYLGAGALLAMMERSDKFRHDAQWRNTVTFTIKVAGVIGFFVFALLQLFPLFLSVFPALAVVREFGLILLFISITMGAAFGFKGLAGRFLSAKPMLFIGQISYGLYLVHNFIPYFTNKLLRDSLDLRIDSHLLLLINSSVLLVLCSILYHFFERPLNKYKNNFPYVLASSKAEVHS